MDFIENNVNKVAYTTLCYNYI